MVRGGGIVMYTFGLEEFVVRGIWRDTSEIPLSVMVKIRQVSW